MLRVYVEETPIKDDNNVHQGQQDMFNDEFYPVNMNNPDDEIDIGEGEGESDAQVEGSDLESKFLPLL